MNALDLVKAIKSATGDFGTFWKNFVDLFQNVSKVFNTFDTWNDDRLAAVKKSTDGKWAAENSKIAGWKPAEFTKTTK